MTLYSTAVCLEKESAQNIHVLRQEIKKIIGPFGRENTQPHFTINIFPPIETVFKEWRIHLKERISFVDPFEINLASIDFFILGNDMYALCLFPNEKSSVNINRLIKVINTKSPKALKKINTPHVTVAYGLNEEMVWKIRTHFEGRKFEIRFECNKVCIRMRKEGKYEHYKIVEEFPFGMPAESLLF